MTFVWQFIFSFAGVLGFAFLTHVPQKRLALAGFIGAIAWLVYFYMSSYENSPLMGCFLGACVVGILADLLAKITKEAATVYIIPGIIPLVPGSGMYYTTLYFISGEIDLAVTKGTETLMMAGGICLGLLAVNSVGKLITSIVKIGKK